MILNDEFGDLKIAKCCKCGKYCDNVNLRKIAVIEVNLLEINSIEIAACCILQKSWEIIAVIVL